MLGFAHEHQRPDRDTMVTVNWGNIPVQNYLSFNQTNLKCFRSKKHTIYSVTPLTQKISQCNLEHLFSVVFSIVFLVVTALGYSRQTLTSVAVLVEML